MSTIPRARLAQATTTELIDQYKLGISSHKGRNTNVAPRQKRINYIVDLLSARADDDDVVALQWLEED
jgi:hypothetical protein